MTMRTHSAKEKRDSWRITIGSILVGGVLLVILVFIGFPSDLWTPMGGGGFLRSFLTAGLIACGSVALIGPTTSLEDSEVRHHTGTGPMINPVTGQIGALAGMGVIASIVLMVRYLYLIIF